MTLLAIQSAALLCVLRTWWKIGMEFSGKSCPACNKTKVVCNICTITVRCVWSTNFPLQSWMTGWQSPVIRKWTFGNLCCCNLCASVAWDVVLLGFSSIWWMPALWMPAAWVKIKKLPDDFEKGHSTSHPSFLKDPPVGCRSDGSSKQLKCS